MDSHTINEIFNVIYSYTNRGKLINEFGLERITQVVTRRLGLNKFLTSLSLKESNSNHIVNKEKEFVTLAGYSKYNHDIVLYLDNIEKSINDYDEYPMNDEERVLFANIEIVSSLLHEIIHAAQRTSFMNKSPNYLDNLLYLSFDFDLLTKRNIKKYYQLSLGWFKAKRIIKARNSKYHKTYDINPCERIANIRSFEVIVDHFNNISDDKYKRISDIEYVRYLDYLTGGYNKYDQDYSCPTEDYLTKVGLDEIWKKMSFYHTNPRVMFDRVRQEYTLPKRLEYGFPVSESEIELVNNNKEKVRERILG
jgi:hypothetical protein